MNCPWINKDYLSIYPTDSLYSLIFLYTRWKFITIYKYNEYIFVNIQTNLIDRQQLRTIGRAGRASQQITLSSIILLIRMVTRAWCVKNQSLPFSLIVMLLRMPLAKYSHRLAPRFVPTSLAGVSISLWSPQFDALQLELENSGSIWPHTTTTKPQ